MNLIYDCEIIRCIPPKGISILETDPSKYPTRFGDGFQYCSGWSDFENMGISVIAVADLFSEYSEVFSLDISNPDPIPPVGFSKLQNLFVENKIMGFNSRNFDDKLCYAHGLNVQTSLDLLEEVRIAAYGSPSWEDQPQGFSYSLNAIAQSNGLSKTGHGELAPKLWQEGKREEVSNYCLNDVLITKELLLKFLEGTLIDPNTGSLLKYEGDL